MNTFKPASIGNFKDKYFKELKINSIGTVFKDSCPLYFITFDDKEKGTVYNKSIEEFNALIRKLIIEDLIEE